jgi:glyoxylase-like metal-dependent hydrolase (beta-lactamase superfamily II)
MAPPVPCAGVNAPPDAPPEPPARTARGAASPLALAASPADFVPGRAVALAAGVRRIVAPNPGLMTGPGTNTYLIGRRDVVVLDPGPAVDSHLEAVVAAVGGARVVAVAVTHTHRDHSPGATPLRARLGAPLVGQRARHAAFQDPDSAPDTLADEGFRLATDAGELVAIATPGHASNHVCWHQPALRLLYTGDHVLGTVSPVILPPDGDMTEYLESLARLRTLDLEAFAPGHGPLVADPAATIDALVRHRLAREARVVEALATLGRASLETLLPAVYHDVASELHRYARYSLEAHLLKLEREGRARRDADEWLAR